MAFLRTFEWEIFLSYGWAENPHEGQGTRGWAEDLRTFLADRFGADRKSPRIHFDVNAWRTGTIDDHLRQALERSGIMVFVVSPGSYRVDSYCQMEAVHYWDHARPLVSRPEVLAPENRIFKVVQTPVPVGFGAEPEPLRDLRPYNIFEPEEGRSQDLSALGHEPLRELGRFYGDLLQTLDRIQALEERPTSGSRVFLGPAFSKLNRDRFRALRRELLLEGHEVISATPLPSGSEREDEFRGRIQRSHEGVALAVHIVSQQLELPPQWNRNVAENVICHSLRKSAGEQLFSVYIWKDPDEDRFDERSLRQIEEISGVSGNQKTKSMIFEDLKTNVLKCLRERRVRSAPDQMSFDVVIEHWDLDSNQAASIREYLKGRGWIAQFAIPTENGTNRLRIQKKNQQRFYSRATRFLILYGQANNEWADDICYAMQPYARDRGSGLVLLAPPQEPPRGKQYYRNPHDVPFLTEPCFDGEFGPKLDAWLGAPPNR